MTAKNEFEVWIEPADGSGLYRLVGEKNTAHWEQLPTEPARLAEHLKDFLEALGWGRELERLCKQPQDEQIRWIVRSSDRAVLDAPWEVLHDGLMLIRETVAPPARVLFVGERRVSDLPNHPFLMGDTGYTWPKLEGEFEADSSWVGLHLTLYWNDNVKCLQLKDDSDDVSAKLPELVRALDRPLQLVVLELRGDEGTDGDDALDRLVSDLLFRGVASVIRGRWPDNDGLNALCENFYPLWLIQHGRRVEAFAALSKAQGGGSPRWSYHRMAPSSPPRPLALPQRPAAGRWPVTAGALGGLIIGAALGVALVDRQQPNAPDGEGSPTASQTTHHIPLEPGSTPDGGERHVTAPATHGDKRPRELGEASELDASMREAMNVFRSAWAPASEAGDLHGAVEAVERLADQMADTATRAKLAESLYGQAIARGIDALRGCLGEDAGAAMRRRPCLVLLHMLPDSGLPAAVARSDRVAVRASADVLYLLAAAEGLRSRDGGETSSSALDLLERTLDADGEHVAALVSLGDTLTQQGREGDLDAAAESLDRAARLAPGDASVQSARRRLASRRARARTPSPAQP